MKTRISCALPSYISGASAKLVFFFFLCVCVRVCVCLCMFSPQSICVMLYFWQKSGGKRNCVFYLPCVIKVWISDLAYSPSLKKKKVRVKAKIHTIWTRKLGFIKNNSNIKRDGEVSVLSEIPKNRAEHSLNFSFSFSHPCNEETRMMTICKDLWWKNLSSQN